MDAERDRDRAAEARRGGRIYRILANDPTVRLRMRGHSWAVIDRYVESLRGQGAMLPGDRWMVKPTVRAPWYPEAHPPRPTTPRAPRGGHLEMRTAASIRRQTKARFDRSITALQRLPLSLLAVDPVALGDLLRREDRLDRRLFFRSWLCARGPRCPEHRLLRAVFGGPTR